MFYSESPLFKLAILASAIIGIILILYIFLMLFYKTAKTGTALIRHGIGGPKVSFNGIIALPFIHRVEEINTTHTEIHIDYDENHPLLTKDKQQLNATFRFSINVYYSEDGVKRVAFQFGAKRTFDENYLTEKFAPLFASSISEVICQIELEDVRTHQEEIRYKILDHIGKELNGYIIDDIVLTLK